MKNENRFSVLIQYQKICWYFLFVIFGAVVIFDFTGVAFSFDPGFYAAVLTLFITFFKLILMAEQFRKIGIQRYMFLAYATIIVLLIIVILKVFI